MVILLNEHRAWLEFYFIFGHLDLPMKSELQNQKANHKYHARIERRQQHGLLWKNV